MHAALYRRVSTDQQTGSLAVQDQICLDYARLKGWIIPPEFTFEDEDTSGTVPMVNRQGGARLLLACRHGVQLADDPNLNPTRPKHLIVAKLDRLGRNVEDILKTVKLLDSLGVCIHFVDLGGEILTTQGAIGKVIITIMAAFAEYERDRIAERITDRFRHKRANGELVSHPPYGWDAIDSGRVNPKTGRPVRILEPNLDEQRWIRYMAQLRAGGASYAAIAKELNRLGVAPKTPAGTVLKTKTGTKVTDGTWALGSVAHVLSSSYTIELLKQAA